MTGTEKDEDDIALDKLLAEFKENRRREAEENAGQLTRLEIDVPKNTYNLCDRAAAQIGISLDQFVADILKSYLAD